MPFARLLPSICGRTSGIQGNAAEYQVAAHGRSFAAFVWSERRSMRIGGIACLRDAAYPSDSLAVKVHAWSAAQLSGEAVIDGVKKVRTNHRTIRFSVKHRGRPFLMDREASTILRLHRLIGQDSAPLWECERGKQFSRDGEVEPIRPSRIACSQKCVLGQSLGWLALFTERPRLRRVGIEV